MHAPPQKVHAAETQRAGATRTPAAGSVPSELQVALEGRNKGRVQPKLRVGAPNDPHEDEADRVADEVMRMPAAVPSTAPPIPDKGIVRRAATEDASEAKTEDDDELVRRRAIPHAPTSGQSNTAAHSSANAVPAVSPRFGRDFSRVCVHTGSPAAESAGSIDALGYTFSDQIPIHPKLVVGSPRDHHEQEADRVAEQVMRLPPGIVHDVTASHGEQKTGAANEEHDGADDVQVRRMCSKCEEEKESPAIRRKADASKLRSDQESVLDAHVLSSGGAPLPDGVRTFFEPRFQRDFREVRVHTGRLAERYADRLHAHAFTYGNHVWMGRDQHIDSSSLLAHELAHVVQQARLPSLVSRSKSQADVVGHRDAAPTVRRFTPFWEPFEIKSGGGNHAIVLPVMGARNKIFTEAPVPNSDLLSSGHDKKGKADFLRADNTVGVFFTGHATPAELKSDRDLKKDGGKFDHKGSAAPKADVAGVLRNSATAPKSVVIGDLKPSHGTIEALEGTQQVLNYKAGFELAHRESNDPKTYGDGKLWNPFSAEIMGRDDLQIPERFTHPDFTDQAPRRIVLKKGSSKNVVHSPNPPMSGRICVRPDPSNTGIWNYTWVPTTTPRAADLPPKIRRLGPQVVQKIVDPLTHSPLQPAKKAKPGLPPPTTRLTGAPAVQRKSKAVAPAKDSFDYSGQWEPDRTRLTGEFNAEKKTQDFKDVEGQILAAQAHDAIRRQFGLPLPEVAGAREPGRILDQVEFWTGASAKPFGLFRNVFGTAFVKVAQVIVKVRDRIREFLKNRRSHAGVKTGFLGAALKAAFRVMKMAAAFVVGRVVDRLMQSLFTGVANRLKTLFAGETQEQLAKKVAEVQKFKEELERKALDSVEELLKKVLGTQLKDLERIDEVYNLFSDVVGLVNLVRWGARVVACLSPPALGCLWILGEAALDFAAQKVAETCWFQKKIAPMFTKVKYLTTDLPNSLTELAVDRIRGFLPASLHDILATVEGGGVTLSKDDIECDEEDTTEYKVHPLHNSIDALYLKIGDERANALSQLLKKAGPADRALSSSQIAELGDAIVKNGVTAEQLLQYEANFPTVPGGIPLGVSAFIERVQKGTPPPAEETATPQVEVPAPVPAEEQRGVDGATPGEGGTAKEGAEVGEGGSGGGVAVFDASSRPTTVKGTAPVEGSVVQVINPSSSHTKGTKPRIHVLVYVDGKIKAMVRDIDTVVIRRELFPKTAASLENAAGLLIYYAPQNGVDLRDLTGGIISAYDPKRDKETVIPALVLTKLGEEALGKIRAKQGEKGM